MATIKVTGGAVVITSAMTLEALRTIAKYRPKALTLMGGEDGKEPVFAVNIAHGGAGSVNQYGASFSPETNDAGGKATITAIVTGIAGDIKEAIADSFGATIINLNKLEATLPAALEEINAEKAAVLSNITVD